MKTNTPTPVMMPSLLLITAIIVGAASLDKHLTTSNQVQATEQTVTDQSIEPIEPTEQQTYEEKTSRNNLLNDQATANTDAVPTDEELEKLMIDFINQYRETKNLNRVEYDKELSIASKQHAKTLATQRSGPSNLWHAASRENCYYGNSKPEAALRAWQRSRGHNALLLSPTATHMGVAREGKNWVLRARTVAATTTRQTEKSPAQPVISSTAGPECPSGTCGVNQPTTSSATYTRVRKRAYGYSSTQTKQPVTKLGKWLRSHR